MTILELVSQAYEGLAYDKCRTRIHDLFPFQVLNRIMRSLRDEMENLVTGDETFNTETRDGLLHDL